MGRNGKLAFVGMGLLTLVALAPAQEKKGAPQEKTPAQQFEQAVLVEESEHDLERAVDLFRGIGDDTSAPAEVRIQALTHLAACLKKLKRDDQALEAKIKALLETKKLDAEVAKKAKQDLQDGGDRATVEQRVTRAIDQLIHYGGRPRPVGTDALKGQPGVADLVWAGQAAVGPLVHELGQQSDDLETVSAIVQILITIGGEEAAATLRDAAASPDLFWRRTFVNGIHGEGRGQEPVREALLRFLRDDDRRIRWLAFEQIADVMSDDEVAECSRDVDAEVRADALRVLTMNDSRFVATRDLNWKSRVHATYSSVALAAIRRGLDDGDAAVRRVAMATLGETLLASAEGRALFLDCVGRVDLDDGADAPWVSSGAKAPGYSYDPPLSTDQLLTVARKLAPFPRQSSDANAKRNPRQEALGVAIARCYAPGNGESNVHNRWTDADRPALREMLKLGVGSELWNWFGQFGNASDATAIAEAMASNGEVSGGAVLQRWTSDLPEGDRRRIAASLWSLFAAIQARSTDPALKNVEGDVVTITRLLESLSLEETDAELVQFTRTYPIWWPGVASNLVTREKNPPSTAVLAALAVTPSNEPSAGRVTRSQILKLLARRRAPELPQLLPEAYRQGVAPLHESLNQGRPSAECGSFLDLIGHRMEQRAFVFAPNYPDDVVLRCFDECVRTEAMSLWEDMANVLLNSGDVAKLTPLQIELSRRIAGAVLSCRGTTQLNLIKWIVSDRLPGWDKLALEKFDDPALGNVILSSLTEVPVELSERIRAKLSSLSGETAATAAAKLALAPDDASHEALCTLLHHPDFIVRRAAVDAVASALPARAVDELLPLTTDPHKDVRKRVCVSFMALFDRRTLPALIEMLRDPEKEVSDLAKFALDKLQYYFDQKEHWTKLLQGAGLDANNAAEALLKQAAAAQPKATRLAAIESLGTLGVAETLPFLVQFMSDGDAEIVAAAKSAVALINRRAAAHVEAPSATKEKEGGGN